MKVNHAIDRDGAPVLLLAGASIVVPTKSGNPAHDVGNGRFGATGRPKKKVQPTDTPAPDPAQGSDQRRRDAVVDAARTLEDLSSAGVEKFVRQRWRSDRPLTSEDIDAFAADARRQRLHDVVDALDYRIRKAVYGRAGSRHMHVDIPRGIARKSLAGLERDDLLMVFQRLRERGWNIQQIKRHGIRRIDTSDKRLQGLLG